MPPTRWIAKQNLSRIYSGLRPFVIRTVERLIEAGLVTGEDTPAKARPLVHADTHMFGGVEDTDDELLVDNLTTLAVNRSGVDIPIHTVVYIDAVGFDDDFGLSRPAVDLADTTDGAKLPPLGITRDAIPDDGEGRVTRAGRLEGLDTATAGWLVGEELYLDPATPGGMTNVIPTTGTVYRIGTVLADEVGPGAPAAPEDEQQGELLVDIENLTDIVGEGPSPAPHATTHEDGGSDELEVSDLATSELDDSLVLKPDGAGGVEWGAGGGGVLTFTKSGVYFHGGDDDVTIWRAPFSCTVTNVRGYRTGGSAATINARRNGTSEHLSSDLSLGTPDVWADGGAVQNTAYVAGDSLEFRRKSATGKPAITIQVDFTLP